MLRHESNDRGYRTKMAKALNVHPSYITRIVSEAALISPDQAIALSKFWGFSELQTEYFFWLVMVARASIPSMRSFAQENVAKLRIQLSELGSDLQTEILNDAEHIEYYSSWTYAAVHMFLTLNTPPSVEEIAKRLGIADNTVRAIINYLQQKSLIEFSKNSSQIRTKKESVHLSNKSTLASRQHQNFRLLGTNRVGQPGLQDVRYSGFHTLSKGDLNKLRDHIRQFLVEIDRTVRPSSPEIVFAITLDAFEL